MGGIALPGVFWEWVYLYRAMIEGIWGKTLKMREHLQYIPIFWPQSLENILGGFHVRNVP